MVSRTKILPEKTTSIISAVCTAFITSFSGSALNPAIPDMGESFGMSASTVGWIVNAYMLVIAALSVPFGKLADSTSRRNVLLTGVGIFFASCLLVTFASTTAMLMGVRVLQGIGAAMIFATNLPIVMNKFSPKERGRIIGIVTGGTYLGLAIGPAIGGMLNTNFGWESIFFFGAFVSLFSFIISVFGLKKDAAGEKLRADIKGCVFYIPMIALIIYGLSNGWIFMATGVVFGIIFVLVELKADNPIIDVRLFKRDRIYTLSNITALFNYAATFALGYLTSIYLQVALGLSSQTAGLVLIAQPVFMVLLTPKMGGLSDRVAPYKLAAIGQGICGLALASYMLMDENTPVWVFVIALAAAGVGIAFFSSPNTNLIMSRVQPSQFGVANSIVSTMRTSGQSSGMAVLTLIVANMAGSEVSLYSMEIAQLTEIMHMGFMIFTALCAIGLVMSLSRGEKKAKRAE